jgi:preprotein translocase subunit SecE
MFESIVAYVKGAYDELVNHVVWPSWQEVQKLTVVVTVFTLVFSLFIFVVDYMFRKVLGLYYKLIR